LESLQVSNTIEGRILKIQQRKTAIIKEAFKTTQVGGGGEKDKESVENLRIMFGEDLEDSETEDD
jgi:DNA repair protein RAD5